MTRYLLFFLLLGLLGQTAYASEQLFKQLDKNQDGLLVADEIEPQHQRLFQRLLRNADEDQDNRLSSSEFVSGLQSQTPPKPMVKKQGGEMPGAKAVMWLLAQMDANSDGRIVEKEVPKSLREVYQKIEAKTSSKPDGVLSRQELAKAAPRLSNIAMKIVKQRGLDVEVEIALLTDKQWLAVQRLLSNRPKAPAGNLTDPKAVLKYIRGFDSNDDREITRDEVPKRMPDRIKQLLKRADRDGDQQLNKQELSALTKRLRNRASQQGAKRLTPAQQKQAKKKQQQQRKKQRKKRNQQSKKKQTPESKFIDEILELEMQAEKMQAK